MNRFFKNSVLQNLKKSPSQKLGLNSKQFGSSFQYLHRANESGNLIFKRQISTLSAIQYSHIYSYMSFKRYFSDDFNKYKVIEVHNSNKKLEQSPFDQKPFTVALIGRTNVGKSALYNRLVGKREALVCKEVNTTRDRREGRGRISGLQFNLIDTGGVWMNPKQGSIEEAINNQTKEALLECNIVLFMLDIHDGITPQDKEIARWLRNQLKYNPFQVQVVLNKCEGKYGVDTDLYSMISKEIYSLGFGSPIGISAEHGEGLLDIFDVLMPFAKKEETTQVEDSVNELLTTPTMTNDNEKYNLKEVRKEEKKKIQCIDIETHQPIDDHEHMKLCIIGKPNSGKSTLLNTLIGRNRFITGDLPGLTRDSISTEIQYKDHIIELVDTAGIKKNSYHGQKTANSLSIMNTYKSISLSHVICLLLDGEKQLTREEISFANTAIEEGKALFICLNKCDLFQDTSAVKQALIQYMNQYLPQIGKAPTLLISAKNNIGLNSFFDVSFTLFDKWRTRVSTSILNRWLRDALERQTPPRVNGKQIHLKYITQIKTRPPTFVIFANREGLSANYLRYLESGLRKDFGFDGVPIRIYIRVPSSEKRKPFKN